MILASTVSLSAIAIVIASASLLISLWQAVIRWQEFGNRRRARIAVDPGSVRTTPDQWIVQLWLTNVGASHARRVRVWLEDEEGRSVADTHRLLRPLLAGGESSSLEIAVPKNGRSHLKVRPVRKWRDAREVKDPWTDHSDQWITLE